MREGQCMSTAAWSCKLSPYRYSHTVVRRRCCPPQLINAQDAGLADTQTQQRLVLVYVSAQRCACPTQDKGLAAAAPRWLSCAAFASACSAQQRAGIQLSE